MSEKISTSEEAIISGRREKAARVRARGENPFANDSRPDTLFNVRWLYSYALVPGTTDRYNPDLISQSGEPKPGEQRDNVEQWHAEPAPLPKHIIAGRIIFMRRIGGATFIRLRDRTGELQIYCEEKNLGESYSKLEDLDLGDIIECSGTAMATVKGELSINALALRLLTKSYRPLPTKTALKDQEIRYRQRYVDLISNPEVASVFRARSQIVHSIRNYFNGLQFLEVETPTMQQLPGGAFAKPFATHHNALDMDLFMRVAPELYLKRLVVGGFDRVFEIGRNYRNEGISTRHNPEFTMLEYYQAYTDLNNVINRTTEMLLFVDQELSAVIDPKVYKAWVQARTFTLYASNVVTMRDAISLGVVRAGIFGMPLNIDQHVHLPDAPIKEWATYAKKNGGREIDWGNWRKAAQKAESAGERMFLAYEYLAEPFLTQDYRTEDDSKSVPVFITKYPVEVSPLARAFDDDPAFTDRFELFIDGRELCNAFAELNDPDVQEARFQEQVAKKTAGAEETMPYDKDYIRALEYGMPPTTGFGMGIDRLVMLLTNSSSIRDVILFPLLRPE